jgi:hypothetical protein
LRLIPSGLLLIPIALFMKLFLLLFCGEILFCVVFFPCVSSLLRLLSHSFLSLIFAAEGSKQGSFVLLHLHNFQHLQMSRVLQTDCIGFHVFSL